MANGFQTSLPHVCKFFGHFVLDIRSRCSDKAYPGAQDSQAKEKAADQSSTHCVLVASSKLCLALFFKSYFSPEVLERIMQPRYHARGKLTDDDIQHLGLGQAGATVRVWDSCRFLDLGSLQCYKSSCWSV